MLSAVELKKLSDELFNYFTVLSKEGSQIDHYLYEAVKHNLDRALEFRTLF